MPIELKLSVAQANAGHSIELRLGTPDAGEGQYVAAAGWAASQWGAHSLTHWRQAVAPIGFSGIDWGAAAVVNVRHAVAPTGILGLSFGVSSVQNLRRFVRLAGWGAYLSGQPRIQNWQRFLLQSNEGARYTQWGTAKLHIPFDQVATLKGLDATQWGMSFVSHAIRWLEQHEPHAGPQVGTASVIHRNRTISVPWSEFTQWGQALVGRHATLSASGLDSMRLGGAAVEHGNVIKPGGWLSQSIAEFPAWASRSRRVLLIEQRSESTEWGWGASYNLQQHITHDGFPWEHEGTKFGVLAWVYNRDRTVSAFGLDSLRFGIASDVVNAAHALYVLPFNSLEWGSTFIAPGIRTVAMGGINSFRMSNYGTLVHNAARVVSAISSASLRFGQAAVASNLQTIRPHSGPVESFGMAFLAPAVRYIEQAPALSASSRYGTPAVSLRWQHVMTVGVPPAGTGAPVVLGPFIRRLRPSWTMRDGYGFPVVRNATPQLYPPGRPFSEWGEGVVDYRDRGLRTAGIEPPVVTRPAIRFRTQRLVVLGWYSFGHQSNATQVRNALPDPPAQQNIVVRPADAMTRFGGPIMNLGFAYPNGWLSNQWGDSSVRLQGAIIRTFYAQLEVGEPRVDLRVRRIHPKMIPDDEQTSDAVFGKSRVTPHTIWARTDTPEQAAANHPGLPFHPIGSHEIGGYQDSRWPWFGHTVISLSRRAIGHRQLEQHTGYGSATLTLRTQYLAPGGISPLWMPFPVFLPHRRKMHVVSWESVVVGEAVVSRAPGSFQRLDVTGRAEGAMGWLAIDNFHRNIAPSGFAATAWGNNVPMVHFPRHFEIGAGVLSQWGNPWVSRLHREVAPAGMDALEMDWVRLRDRMSVVVRHRLEATGADSVEVPMPCIRNAQQFIAPYMISPRRCCRNGLDIRHAS